MDTAGLDSSILGPAFLAGLLIVATHVPMGREVLRRGIIFIDLAIAQIAGLGVLAAQMLHLHEHSWMVQAVAYGCAVCGALMLYFFERRWAQVQEAVIGVVFVTAASAGILLLASNPQAGEHLRDLLVGQILWVDYADLLPVAVLYATVLLVWNMRACGRNPLVFYLVFAATVTASVQLVGVYLVFASLIVPALAAYGLSRGAVFRAVTVGVLGYAIGLVLSALLDLPSGAVIVLTLVALALGSRLLPQTC